jgi:hypothetical protein
MSSLKPLQSLNAPNAEPLEARSARQSRTGQLVLIITLLLAVVGAGAGGLAWMFTRSAGPPRPAEAVALENHLRKAGVDATVSMTMTRRSHARWQALLYVESKGKKYGMSLTQYDSAANAAAESRVSCSADWNTCQRRGALVVSVREDEWSKSDPARAKMLAAFSSFPE